jgi:IS605 OrfB family transposase
MRIRNRRTLEALLNYQKNIIDEHAKTLNKGFKNKKYIELSKKVVANTNNIWLPLKMKPIKEYKTDSWFNASEYKSNKINDILDVNIEKSKEKVIKCDVITIYPTKKQKQLLNNWFKYYVVMYNETIKLFKRARRLNIKLTLNWKTIRTKYLKYRRNKIQKKSQMKNFKQNTKIAIHILDFAIQSACASYKSCLTNLKNGNIKHFRLRYLKQSKKNKIIKMEKCNINKKNNTFYSTVFRDSFKFFNNFRLSEITSDFIVHYNKKTNVYKLLSPIKLDKNNCEQKDTVSIDPGIRTFMTTYSTNKCTSIGDNLMNKLEKYFYQINRVQNCRNNKRKKIKKTIQKYNKKIEHVIDDLHWKSINYLIKNYGNILIGNLSTKQIISNKNNLHKSVKKVASAMSLFKFKQRLQYKCLKNNIGYFEVDEAYTSKTCTKCSSINENLRGQKIFNCPLCKYSINRDINGARNILLKYLK